MRPLVPTPAQTAAIEKMVTEPTRAALNCSGLGTGKTVMAVELAKALSARTVLVVAPIGTHVGWIRTFQRQGTNLPIVRIQTVEDFDLLRTKTPGIYVVGREMYYLGHNSAREADGSLKMKTVTKDGKETEVPVRLAKWDWRKTNPDLHIVDESHSAQNRWGLMFKTLKTHPSKFRLAMSGTPQGSTFDGFWSVTRWLWPALIDRSKTRWVAEWCDQKRVVKGKNEDGELEWVTKIVGEKTPGKFLTTLPCVVQLVAAKVPYRQINGMVNLTPAMREAWDDMKDKNIAWLKDNPMVAKLPIERRIRLRQMALAYPTVTEVLNEEGEIDVMIDFDPDAESPKIDASLKIQARHPGEKILFLTDSAKFAKIAAPRIGAELYYGPTPKKVRAALVDAFGDPKGPQYLLATYQAVAEGTDGLQLACHIEVRFNAVDSPVLEEQVGGRLNRIGQSAPEIIRYDLIARDTLDDLHLNTLDEKVSMRRKELRL